MSAIPPGEASRSIGTADAASSTASAAATQQKDPKVWKAAQDFEAMTVNQLLEPMFATLDQSGGFFGGGAGEQNFRPMLITEMAKAVEQRGGLGLAQPIYEQMLKMQEKPK